MAGVDGEDAGKEEEEDEDLEFEDMGLDPRLLKALAKQAILKPTPIQLKAIPLILEGKDVVARAMTGSGKTYAYLLPLVQKILGEVRGMPREGPTAIVLVPSQELCQQVHGVLTSILERCGEPVTAVQLSRTMSVSALRAALAGPPDVVLATPARAAFCISEHILLPAAIARSLRTLVLDEADLLLSYGYEDDLRRLVPHVPRQCQCLLMSATSSADVDKLKKLLLHNPVTLTLMEVPGSTDESIVPTSVQQFQIMCKEKDKLLHLLALVRLELIRKKGLFFVNSINSGFRIKLFLEQFGIKTAVLNAELPQNSRLHILQEFNAGLFDYLVATDDATSGASDGNADKQDEEAKKESSSSGEASNKKNTILADMEFSVVRGIDFKNVRTVINYDMPVNTSGYIHRIGRTGRARQSGIAISLVRPKEAQLLKDIEIMLNNGKEEKAKPLSEFPLLTKKAVESLRYRAEDVARHVTTLAIREARVKEIRYEILNSERLKAHFQDNPTDLALLKHDKVLSKKAPAAHLATIPEYLQDPVVEAASRSLKLADEAIGQSKQNYTIRKRKKRRDDDPLQTFSDHAKKRRGELAGAGGASGTLVTRKVARKGSVSGKIRHPSKKKHVRRKQ